MSKFVSFYLADLLILLIILLDAGITILGINQEIDLFLRPDLVASHEGNPFVQVLFNLGLHAFVLGGLVWMGFALYLFRKANHFRFFVFTGFFFLHFVGFLSWVLKIALQRTSSQSFWQYLLLSLFFAVIFGFIISLNKTFSGFLDRKLVVLSV